MVRGQLIVGYALKALATLTDDCLRVSSWALILPLRNCSSLSATTTDKAEPVAAFKVMYLRPCSDATTDAFFGPA
jgi:hypothetical protein